MKKQLILILLCCVFVGFRAITEHKSTSISFIRPANFPLPQYNFDNNQLTKEGFELGKKLFYDSILSNDNTIACSSCHKQGSAFADSGVVVSPGAGQRLGTRNSPPIMNLAWSASFFWDGNVDNLDLQPIVPITSHVEMDEQMDSVIDKLKRSPAYRSQFLQAFGNETITTSRIMKALSQFMLMCVSSNSKYDKVMRKEGYAFTAEEKKGYALVKQKCGACHAEPLFTNYSLRNNGLEPGHFPDEGRFIVSKDAKDKMKFKVPSLRNLSFTAPYMHDGRFASLNQVLDHYTTINSNTNADSLLIIGSSRRISLSIEEKQSVLAFLKTLDDSSFLENILLRQAQ